MTGGICLVLLFTPVFQFRTFLTRRSQACCLSVVFSPLSGIPGEGITLRMVRFAPEANTLLSFGFILFFSEMH